jgi:hypothetical protein
MQIITTLTAIALTYVIFTFVSLDINCFDWHPITRFAWIFFTLFVLNNVDKGNKTSN